MSSMVNVHIIAVDSCYQSACLAIATESGRYLFEVGEGTQRLAIEHKLRIGKINGVFLTSALPCSLAGLPGMLLTIDDSGAAPMDIYGPSVAATYLSATRNFMRPLGNFHGVAPAPAQAAQYKKKTADITISPIGLFSTSSTPERYACVCYFAETAPIPGKFFVEKAAELGVPKGPLFGKLKSGHTIVLPNGESVSPAQVLGPPTLSQFVAIVARLDDSDEVMWQSLEGAKEFHKFHVGSGGTENERLRIMVHLSARAVIATDRYQRWLSLFGENVQHVFIGQDAHTLSPSYADALTSTYNLSSFWTQIAYNAELNALFGPDVFPLVLPNVREKERDRENNATPHTLAAPENTTQINPETHTVHTQKVEKRLFPVCPLKLHVLPLRLYGECDAHPTPHFSTLTETFLRETREKRQQELLRAETLRAETCGSALSEAPASQLSRIHSDTRLLFLGTGCAIPSKYRNVSAVALYNVCEGVKREGTNESESVSERTSGVMLLDSGEGTWWQLMNCTPPSLSSQTHTDVPSPHDVALAWASLLHAVWVSHPHADHHLGLVSVIRERALLLRAGLEKNGLPSSDFVPLLIIAPQSVGRFLKALCDSLYPAMHADYVFVSLSLFLPAEFCQSCVRDVSVSVNAVSNVSDTTTEATTTVASMASMSTRSNRSARSEKGREKDKDGERDWKRARTEDERSQKERERERERERLGEKEEDFSFALSVLHTLGVASLVNVPVIHCNQAYGIVLSLHAASHSPEGERETWKLVYSGDTRPCESLVLFGKDAAILIHEATFEDDQQVEALQKRHSTINEAVSVSEAMGAERLILTHFSQRYHGVPKQFHPSSSAHSSVVKAASLSTFNELRLETGTEEKTETAATETATETETTATSQQPMDIASEAKPAVDMSRTTIAFDFMSLGARELLWTPRLTPLLAELFPAEEEEEAEKNETEKVV